PPPSRLCGRRPRRRYRGSRGYSDRRPFSTMERVWRKFCDLLEDGNLQGKGDLLDLGILWRSPMATPESHETFRFHDFELDVAAYELRREGRPVRLER